MSDYINKINQKMNVKSVYLSLFGIVVSICLKLIIGFRITVIFDFIALIIILLVLLIKKKITNSLVAIYAFYVFVGPIILGFEYDNQFSQLMGSLTFIIPIIIYYLAYKFGPINKK